MESPSPSLLLSAAETVGSYPTSLPGSPEPCWELGQGVFLEQDLTAPPTCTSPLTLTPPTPTPAGLSSLLLSPLPMLSSLHHHPSHAPSTHPCYPQVCQGLQPARSQGHSSGAPPITSCVPSIRYFNPSVPKGVLSPFKRGY